MAAQWFYGREGQQNGPVSTEQLKQLVVSGQVQPNDLIWKDGMASWVPATQLDQLATSEPQTTAESSPLGATASAQQFAEKASAQFDKLTGGRVKATWAKIAIAAVAALILLWAVASLAPILAIGGGIALAYYWKRLAKPARWAGIGGVALLLIIWAASGEHADVTMVKTGHLSAYPNIPVGKAIDQFMSGARWEAIAADNGQRCVNVRGKVTFMDKSVEAVLQFQVDHKAGTFEPRAFEMNGIPQNAFMMASFLEKMFEQYKK